MKSLKSAARRGLIVATAAASALALASCSAGQITQTSEQVAAVDGAFAENDDQSVSVRDAVIVVDPDTRDAALRFILVNDGYADTEVSIDSVEVDGQTADISGDEPLSRGQTLVVDSEESIDNMPEKEGEDTKYATSSLKDDDFGFGGAREVTFHLSSGDITLEAPIAAPEEVSGSIDRDVESAEGYTTETAGPQKDEEN